AASRAHIKTYDKNDFPLIFSVKLLSGPSPIAILPPYKAQTPLWRPFLRLCTLNQDAVGGLASSSGCDREFGCSQSPQATITLPAGLTQANSRQQRSFPWPSTRRTTALTKPKERRLQPNCILFHRRRSFMTPPVIRHFPALCNKSRNNSAKAR